MVNTIASVVVLLVGSVALFTIGKWLDTAIVAFAMVAFVLTLIWALICVLSWVESAESPSGGAASESEAPLVHFPEGWTLWGSLMSGVGLTEVRFFMVYYMGLTLLLSAILSRHGYLYTMYLFLVVYLLSMIFLVLSGWEFVMASVVFSLLSFTGFVMAGVLTGHYLLAIIKLVIMLVKVVVVLMPLMRRA